MATLTTTSQLYEPSRTIPLPQSHIRRTSSELQLTEDTLVAEARDMIMFDRLIRGIRKKSFEYAQKLPSSIDRELLAQQTLATLEKLFQRKKELINPTSTFQNNEHNSCVKPGESNPLICTQHTDRYDSFSGVTAEASYQSDNAPIVEEIFDIDF
jgi:hypothetical protein